MMFIRENSNEIAADVDRGFYIEGLRGAADQVRVSFGTYTDNYNYVDVYADPRKIAPFVEGMSLVEKLTLRFKEAARRQTDVDLRFCSGDEDMRRPEHDNLREDYGMTGAPAP